MFKLIFIKCFYIVVALTAIEVGFGLQPTFAAEKTASVPEDDIQVLASGPIHEAFAEAIALDPEPGIVAPKAPPALIEEIPPEQKPEGDVQWIPGYWAWDDERNEYIWVSGIWRVPPPDRKWIPGYWTPTGQEYQWISGYWAGTKVKETEYLPDPPESVEIGPSSNAPSPDYTWIPGCWIWQYGRYVWQPGYWAVVHPDWVWVPAHYIWTPRGYIFVGGYWDYTVIHRGVLFAPVFFPPRVYFGLSFSFSPGFVIDLNVFDDALFIRPRYHHYYYGNYYASRYYKTGIYPWFSLHARRVFYDPIYAHQRWHHRNDYKWENHLEKRFRERRELKRFQSAKNIYRRKGYDKSDRMSVPERFDHVMPLNRSINTKMGVYRFNSLNEKKRKQFLHRDRALQTYQKKRQGRETQWQNKLKGKASIKPKPDIKIFSRSPIMDRPNKKADRKKAPPALYMTPKSNPDVEPLMKNNDLSRSWHRSQKSKDREQKPEVREKKSMDNIHKSRNRRGWSDGHMQKFDARQQRSNFWQKRENALRQRLIER